LDEDFAFKFPHMIEVMRHAQKLEGYLNKAADETNHQEIIADLAKKAKEINEALINIKHDMMDKTYQVGDFKKWIGSSGGYSALCGKLENGKWTFKIVKTSDKSVKIDGSNEEKYQFNNPTELSKFLDDNFIKLERWADDMDKKESVSEAKEKWVIRDWAGNYPFEKNPHQSAVDLGGGPVKTFKSFDDAEEFLSNYLSKKYDTDDGYEEARGEYEIMKESVGNIKGQDLHKKIKHNGVEYDVSIEKEMNGYNAVVKHDGDIMLDKVFKTYDEAEEAIMLMLDKYQISSVTEARNPIADYEVTVEIPVEQAAEMVSKKGDLKKALDLDYMDIGGYDVDPTKYNLPKGFDGADVYFKNAVKQAIHSADESAALSAYHKAAIDAVVERFEKVEPTTMEYAGDTSKGEQDYVSVVAGVTSAHYDKDSGKVVVTIKNPHHLINGIISGVGFFGADLPIDEKIDEKETMDRLHNIIDYYDVWGERMPQIDERATENASWDDDMFKEKLIVK
jgi:hypothetical protein